MAKHTELRNQLRKESGIDLSQDRVSAKRWIAWLKDHSDNRLKNLGYGLSFGLQTGRLPNVNYEGNLTKSGKELTNLQAVTAFSKAYSQQDELTTASACKALQSVFGLRIV